MICGFLLLLTAPLTQALDEAKFKKMAAQHPHEKVGSKFMDIGDKIGKDIAQEMERNNGIVKVIQSACSYWYEGNSGAPNDYADNLRALNKRKVIDAIDKAVKEKMKEYKRFIFDIGQQVLERTTANDRDEFTANVLIDSVFSSTVHHIKQHQRESQRKLLKAARKKMGLD